MSQEHQSSIDSVVTLTVKTEAVSVPRSESKLVLPIQSIKSLPAGAKYSERSGRSSVDVRYLHDSIFIDANCDSVSILRKEYSSKVEALRHELSESNKIQTTGNERTRSYRWLWWMMAGVAIGVTIAKTGLMRIIRFIVGLKN